MSDLDSNTIDWVISYDEGRLIIVLNMPIGLSPPNIGDRFAESYSEESAIYRVVDRLFLAEGEEFGAPTTFSWKLEVETIVDNIYERVDENG